MKLYDEVLLLRNCERDNGEKAPAGSKARLIEFFGDDVIVEFVITDPTLEGGFRFETALLPKDAIERCLADA